MRENVCLELAKIIKISQNKTLGCWHSSVNVCIYLEDKRFWSIFFLTPLQQRFKLLLYYCLLVDHTVLYPLKAVFARKKVKYSTNPDRGCRNAGKRYNAIFDYIVVVCGAGVLVESILFCCSFQLATLNGFTWFTLSLNLSRFFFWISHMHSALPQNIAF